MPKTDRGPRGPGPWRAAICAAGLVGLGFLAGLGGTAASRAAELLVFEQRACPFCAAFEREIAPDYPMSRAGSLAPLRHVDIWESRTGGVEGLDPAVFTPTFVLVEDGREIGRLTGYPGRRYFYAELQALIERLPVRRPSAAGVAPTDRAGPRPGENAPLTTP